jgi:FMN phosphatase YigB (HAD superfamily)
MLSSFDIFETTLLRDTLTPSGVFYRVYLALTERIPDFAQITPDEFVAARINAERVARESSSSDEITIAAIWKELAAMLGLQHVSWMAAVEMECESLALFPVAETVQRIDRARREAGRVLFISDTYFPATFLRKILESHSLIQGEDKLYASSEYGKTKKSGSLFKMVLEVEKILPSELIHFGDNLHSDIRIPNDLGIKTGYCLAPKLSRVAVATLNGLPVSNRKLQDLIGYGRKFQQECGSEYRPSAINRLVGDFLGPTCLTMAVWALKRAQARGIKRLYFAARDGRLLWIAARSIAHHYGDIDCRYLHTSRKALLLPAVLETNKASLTWLRRSYESTNISDTLSKLGIEYGQLEHLLAPLNLHPLTPLDSEQRWTALFSILANREPREMILNNSKSLRIEVIRYFEEAGIFDGVKFGLVDVGWYMTCQTAMRQILESVGNFNLDVGLYLGLAVERLPPSLAGSSEALFNTPAADIRNTFSPFHLESNRAGLLEHIVGLAEHPSTIGYASGKPVFGVARISQDFLKSIHAIHAAVEGYCLGANLKTLGDDWSTGNCRQILFSLISGFFANPDPEILKLIRPLEISVNQESGGNQPLFKPLRIRDLILYFKGGKSFLAKSDWPEADLVVTTPLLRKTFEFSKTASSALKNMLRSDNRPAPEIRE